jgi:hypothetical protein
VHHAGFFLAAVHAMNAEGLLHDNRLIALMAHGAAARFIGRVGMARPDTTPPRLIPPMTSAGWALQGTSLGWKPLPGVAGLRYHRVRVSLDGDEAGDWVTAREKLWRLRPIEARVVGPLYSRGGGKDIWIEVETSSVEGVAAEARLGGERIALVRRELPAGDRMIVRYAAPLPAFQGEDAQLEVYAEAPAGMLDFDVFLHGGEDLPDSGPARRPALPFTFEGI